MGELQERYNILNFFHISAANGEGMSVLKEAVLQEFCNMPEFGMKTPIQWLNIKEKLTQLKNDHTTIPYSTYQEICKEEKLNPTSQQALIRFLHQYRYLILPTPTVSKSNYPGPGMGPQRHLMPCFIEVLSTRNSNLQAGVPVYLCWNGPGKTIV